MLRDEPDIMKSIRSKILWSLSSSHKPGWESSSPAFRVGFQVAWNPVDYFSRQYEAAPRDIPRSALTLTGSFTNAQSTTCLEYMQQIWPSSGKQMVALLANVLSSPGQWYDCELLDRTSITARISAAELHVMVYGIEDSIAEVGEQIAWVAAALRLPPGDLGIFGCMPFIQNAPSNEQQCADSGFNYSTADTIIWHLMYNDEGKHISYLDAQKFDTSETILPEDVLVSRHVVGWCQEAEFYTGTAKADYPVQKPLLIPTTADCLLHGLKVPPGTIMIPRHVFNKAHKDKPPYMPKTAMLHREKLNYLKDKHVVLWDVGDERGWLVNGVSAWLHLLRANLKRQFEDDDSHQPELVSPMNPYKARSSLDFSMNSENMNLILLEDEHQGSTRFRTIRDVSDRLFETLDRLLAYQAEAVRKRERASRKSLSGWAFRDLAKELELEAFAITVPDIGKTWIDFARAISAVTLFGRGFGELILPRSPCKPWAKLPTGQFYLATSGLVLNRIIDNIGSSPGHIWRLGSNVVWHNPSGSCKCDGGRRDHSDVVQILLPEDVSKDEQYVTDLTNIEDDSAVIFGYNSEQPWVWQDFGNPTRGSRLLLPERHKHPVSVCGSELEPEPDISRTNTVPLSTYTVGIVCALPKEGTAMKEMFNEIHSQNGNYVLGCIGKHNVALVYLSGQYGTTTAATAAKELGNHFRSITFGLLVGIAGGCPSEENDIRLGDVVVSSPTGAHPGVIQYDLGKRFTNGEIVRTGALKLPPCHVLGTVASLVEDRRAYTRFKDLIKSVATRKTEYQYPGQEEDVWKSAPCKQCEMECMDPDTHMTKRIPRDSDTPKIHRGLIGSGNMVIRDERERDRLRNEYGILCVDMEAAGVMHNTVEIPFIVVRGISDYADSHKTDLWHDYAAITAAAFARVLLERVGAMGKLDTCGPLGRWGTTNGGHIFRDV
ncbi:hypothetical protein F5Y08DRAFT_353825 [Xylaria arbuscula]|nr:hypothetical protein F5Y08DRAFT_353825 [Xylaria arbuscula]